MNPAMIERLKAVENQAEAMERGARSAYLKQQAQELGISLATLYRKLEAVSVKPTRKRRSDAGKTELKQEEAKLISAVLVEAMRRNGKRLMSVRQAVEMLRANGKIEAARIDGETGEVIPSLRTAFRPLARHRPHRPVMAHPRRRHEDQTPLYRPTVGLGSRNTPRAAHTDRRQHPPFPRHPPTAQTRPHPDHISIKFAHNAIRRLGYDGSTPGKSKHTMHGFRHLFTNISLTAGKDTLTTDLALGHISRAALQRADFSSLHHYLTADSYRLQERRELAEWYSRRHRQAYEAAAKTPQNKKPPEKNSDGILPKTLAIKPKRY